MKATETNFLKFLTPVDTQFVIPNYQRTYSWTERECRQLWDDILRTGKEAKNNINTAHFVGSIVYIKEGDLSSLQPLTVARHRRSAASHDRNAYPRSPGEVRG